MAGQITNADIKSQAELLLDLFGPEKLPNTDKIYDANLMRTLDEILSQGLAGGPKVIGTFAAPQIVDIAIDVSAFPDAKHVLVFIEGLNAGDTPILLADIIGATGFAGQLVEIFGVNDAKTVSITDGHNGPITFGNKKIASYLHNGVEFTEKGRN